MKLSNNNNASVLTDRSETGLGMNASPEVSLGRYSTFRQRLKREKHSKNAESSDFFPDTPGRRSKASSFLHGLSTPRFLSRKELVSTTTSPLTSDTVSNDDQSSPLSATVSSCRSAPFETTDDENENARASAIEAAIAKSRELKLNRKAKKDEFLEKYKAAHHFPELNNERVDAPTVSKVESWFKSNATTEGSHGPLWQRLKQTYLEQYFYHDLYKIPTKLKFNLEDDDSGDLVVLPNLEREDLSSNLSNLVKFYRRNYPIEGRFYQNRQCKARSSIVQASREELQYVYPKIVMTIERQRRLYGTNTMQKSRAVSTWIEKHPVDKLPTLMRVIANDASLGVSEHSSGRKYQRRDNGIEVQASRFADKPIYDVPEEFWKVLYNHSAASEMIFLGKDKPSGRGKTWMRLMLDEIRLPDMIIDIQTGTETEVYDPRDLDLSVWRLVIDGIKEREEGRKKKKKSSSSKPNKKKKAKDAL